MERAQRSARVGDGALQRARADAADAVYEPDLAVIDVSFISLAKVLGPVLSCLGGGYDVLALVKPQFEVGRGRVGKGGVVRDAAERRSALVAVGESALALGAAVLGYCSSGLPGPKGNRETFVWLTDPRRLGTHDHSLGADDRQPGAHDRQLGADSRQLGADGRHTDAILPGAAQSDQAAQALRALALEVEP